MGTRIMDRKIKPKFKEIDPGPIKKFFPGGLRAFVFKGESGTLVRVMLSKDAGRWHISVSCKDRYPTWEEIKAARYELVPEEAFMVMALPPPEHYINLHSNAFHLWETNDRGLVNLTAHREPPPDDEFYRKVGGR